MDKEFRFIQNTLFFSILIFSTGLLFWLVSDFALPIFWAVVFAIVFYPLYRLLKKIFRGKETAAAIATIVITLLLVFTPLWGIGTLVAREAITLYFASIDVGSFQPISPAALEQITNTFSILESVGITSEDVENRLTTGAQTVSAWIATQALSIGTSTLGVLIKFVVMLYLLFFALRDGKRLLLALMHMLPLGNTKEQVLFDRFSLMVRSIFKGTLLIALAQGFVGGLLLWIAGVPNVLLWSVVMTLFAVIPAIGPAIVWLPVGIILLLSGDFWSGTIVLVGGVFVISLIDNLLRPILVGKDTAMHDAIIMLSMFGGLAAFGIAGIIIGPVIVSFTIALWQMFEQEYKTQLDERG